MTRSPEQQALLDASRRGEPADPELVVQTIDTEAELQSWLYGHRENGTETMAVGGAYARRKVALQLAKRVRG